MPGGAPTRGERSSGDEIARPVGGRCRRFPRALPAASHAEAVLDWLHQSDLRPHARTEGGGWDLVERWLALASGLRVVDIDLSTRASYLCAGATEYEDAASDTASRVHTELTRLLYVYGSVETAVRSLVPDLPDGAPVTPTAEKLLARAPSADLLHYACNLDHLREHVDQIDWLRSNANLIKRFGNDSVPGPEVGLRVAVKVRHLLAHGAFQTPDPLPGDEAWASGGSIESCVAQRATVSLLHALQMICWHALADGALHASGDCEIGDGLWVETEPGRREWVYEMSPTDRVLTLHLRPGDGPELS